MAIEDAIARFRALHETKKRRTLEAEALAEYDTLRDDFVRAVLQAQRLAVRPGQIPRQMMRVAHSAKVVLTAHNREHETLTLDMSVSGFAALLGQSLPVGTACGFSLRLGPELVSGRARVVACIRHNSGGMSHRASLAIESLAPDHRAHLENAVLDAALASFAR